jgi:hypothetical protein
LGDRVPHAPAFPALLGANALPLLSNELYQAEKQLGEIRELLSQPVRDIGELQIALLKCVNVLQRVMKVLEMVAKPRDH